MIKNIIALETGLVNGGSTCVCASENNNTHVFSCTYKTKSTEECRKYCKKENTYALFLYIQDMNFSSEQCISSIVHFIDLFDKI